MRGYWEDSPMANQKQKDLLAHYEAFHERLKTLTADERFSLERWDREYVDGSGKFATTEWPGVETQDNPWPTPPNKEVH
jgi:hypothetical protein